jgi:hypothetical protein
MTRIVTAPFSIPASPSGSSAGPCPVPEAQVGDLVLFVIDTANGTAAPEPNWAPAVIVAGEILTVFGGPASATTWVAILDRETTPSPHTISLSGMIS